ncbi:MAG: hypothetical protein EKK42_15605 [Pseudonocardiaceae bacterium]|nr:MAG: hypothetical protein EKK42_15605 [Pseudonocardiaceae bacterium]
MSDTDLVIEPAPPELEQAGQQLWRSVVETYELNPGELRILADAAGEADMIAALNDEWGRLGRPMTALGSTKQLVAHPIVQELRAHRTTLRQLLGALKLSPLDSEDAPLDRPMTRSEVGKLGAAHRWGR